jgi:hypothetical protein
MSYFFEVKQIHFAEAFIRNTPRTICPSNRRDMHIELFC